MIKAITFDLDGVYFINGKENFIRSLVSLGVSEDEAKRVFLKSDEMNKIYKCGKWSDEEYWTWALKEWNLNMNVDEICELLISGYEVNQSVVETVKKVHESGYKTMICSNNFPARINGLQRRFGFLDNFDVVVVSFEHEVIKPDKKIFEILVEKSGVEADEIVYSDDNEDALKPALELGINAFLYTDFDSFVQKLNNLDVKF